MGRNLIGYLTEVLRDVDGGYSSKRLVVIVAMLSILVAFFANLFYDMSIEQFMFDGMMYIVIAGLGFVGAEKFSPTTKKDIE